jgi:hypothetical protein
MKKRPIKSDLVRVDLTKDSQIDYSDIPALDKSFFKKASSSLTNSKIRVDGTPPSSRSSKRTAG